MENVATMLAWYEIFGDYKIFLSWAEKLDSVSVENVQEAAKETFKKELSVNGILLGTQGE